ncbi:MAG: alginate export family protein [Longimicrobiales bacterium]
MAMLTRQALAVLLLVPFLHPSCLRGQDKPALTWQGEIRPRFESREPLLGGWTHVMSMRTRIGLRVQMEGGLALFFQPQDVRFWGEETTVRDRSADAIDFHQAYLEVGDLPGIGGTIRAGRQEVAIGESRLMGAPDWGQAGQTFDGARWNRPVGGHRLEVTYLQIREDFAPDHDYDEVFLAASYLVPVREGETAEVYAVHDRNAEPEATRQTSLSGIWKKDTEAFSLRLQGIYQVGERAGVDVRAYLLAVSGAVNVLDGRGSVTLWYDRLSGDENPDDDVVRVFSTLYGARNRFYGRADYFLFIPFQTNGLGLQDGAVKLAYAPHPALSMNLDLHAFRTSAQGEVSSRRLGEEADAWIRYQFRRYLTVQAGYSLTWAGPAMEELGILEGTGNFGYLMTSLKF